MSTIDESLGATLAAILPASPGIAPDATSTPYCIFSRAGATPANTLDGAPGLELVRFVIDIHASTYSEARTYCRAVKAALQAASYGGYVVGDQMAHEDMVNLHRAVIDFEVWATP